MKLLYNGGVTRIKIGFNYWFSWTAPGKLKIFDDKIVIYAFPFKKEILLSKVVKLKRAKWGLLVSYFQIQHNAGGFPFIAFRTPGGANSPNLKVITDILRSKGISWDEMK